MGICFDRLNTSMDDFWNLPFFTMVELVKSVSSQVDNGISRKEILDRMRSNSKKYGWVC